MPRSHSTKRRGMVREVSLHAIPSSTRTNATSHCPPLCSPRARKEQSAVQHEKPFLRLRKRGCWGEGATEDGECGGQVEEAAITAKDLASRLHAFRQEWAAGSKKPSELRPQR